MPQLPQGKLLGSEEVQRNINTKFEEACVELKAKGERQRAEQAAAEVERLKREAVEAQNRPRQQRLAFQKNTEGSYVEKVAELERDAILEDDAELDNLRQQRLAALKARKAEHLANLARGHGEYTEIFEEDFLKTVLASKFCIAHFFHKDYELCQIMDKHLGVIARKHTETRIFKINAEKAPFFVSRLGVKTLPRLVIFEDGKSIDCLVGFSGVRNGKDASTRDLEERLGLMGVIKMEKEFYEDKTSLKGVKHVPKLARVETFDDPFD